MLKHNITVVLLGKISKEMGQGNPSSNVVAHLTFRKFIQEEEQRHNILMANNNNSTHPREDKLKMK